LPFVHRSVSGDGDVVARVENRRHCADVDEVASIGSTDGIDSARTFVQLS
jgi:hypothetical protein